MGQFASAQITSYKMNVQLKDGSVYSVPTNNIEQVFFTVENETVPENQPVTDDVWISLNDVTTMLNNCYVKCCQFEASQKKIEEIRTGNPANVHSITPYSNIINETYNAAYTAINVANVFIANVSSAKLDGIFTNNAEIDIFLAEARCLRAFVYYNLTMLWGNVILITEPMTLDNSSVLAQSTQETIYQFVYSEICDAIDNLPATFNNATDDKIRFTSNSALMLKSEVELSLGYKSAATVSLNSVSTDVFFGFYSDNQTIMDVYTPNILQLYKLEAQNNTTELEITWVSTTDSKYGCWAALKRLGKAQQVTGCYDFELLMPFYYTEIAKNSTMIQNPGY